MPTILKFCPELEQRIVNTAQLSRGTGARYLECITAHDGRTLIAKRFRRSVPKEYEILIDLIPEGAE